MSAITVPVKRGDARVFTVTFYTDEAGTVPWDEVGTFSPVCQIRLSPDSPIIAATPALTIEDNVVTFALTDTVTAGLAARIYEWDVQFTDTSKPEGLRTFSWPGPDAPNNKLKVSADVTRVES